MDRNSRGLALGDKDKAKRNDRRILFGLLALAITSILALVWFLSGALELS